jgi:Asp-tRNA(Asn)/Glu-tRNA(Gln) amidotransferase A subunit family amidase
LDAKEITNNYLKKAKELNPKYNSFLRFHDDYVDLNIEEFKKRPLK